MIIKDTELGDIIYGLRERFLDEIEELGFENTEDVSDFLEKCDTIEDLAWHMECVLGIKKYGED